MSIGSRPQLSAEVFGFSAERLLLPLDLENCAIEALELANRLTKRFGAEVILLYVFPQTALDAAAEAQARLHAESCLQQLSDEGLLATVSGTVRVRKGTPADEIIAEAIESKADLLIVPTFPAPWWKQLLGLPCSRTARELIARSPCRAFVYDAASRLNCLRSGRS